MQLRARKRRPKIQEKVLNSLNYHSMRSFEKTLLKNLYTFHLKINAFSNSRQFKFLGIWQFTFTQFNVLLCVVSSLLQFWINYNQNRTFLLFFFENDWFEWQCLPTLHYSAYILVKFVSIFSFQRLFFV